MDVRKHQKWRRASACAVACGVIVAGGAVVSVGPAFADTTTGGGTAPQLANITPGFDVSPDADTSDLALEFSVDVSDVNSLENLTTVDVCFYHSTAGTNACAATDGRKELKATWTQATDAFTLDDGSGTQADISTSTDTTYSADATSMTLLFKLKVAENHREGDWNVKVTATDDDALTATNDDAGVTDFGSSWYGNVDTARASQTFGAVAAGSASSAIEVTGGKFTSNGTAAVNYAVADLTDGSFTATNDGGADGLSTSPGAIPSADEFALDCSPDDTWNAANDIRVGTTATVVEDNILSTGSAENGDDLIQSCTMLVGTEWKRDSNPLYTGAVTTTISDS